MNTPMFLLNNNTDKIYFGWGIKEEIRLQNPIDFKVLDAFIQRNRGKHIFTVISYDAKNSIEKLQSENKNWVPIPDVMCFVSQTMAVETNGEIQVFSGEWNDTIQADLIRLMQTKKTSEYQLDFIPETDKKTYLQNVAALKNHIQRGDIYEVNYCQNFVAKANEPIDTISIYQTVNGITAAPFSAFIQLEDFALACGSPERYLQRRGNKIISQPIKGTAPRGIDEQEDTWLKEQLLNDPKERAENVMIVDLVRNDLSRIATKGSVKVPELFGIYSFPTVHQMISTVECEVNAETTFSDILKATFPMGSMTGAPKISAMNLIEQYETFQRGIYSGSVGIIQPNGDFDTNVVIRSLAVNLQTNILTCSVGGALTIDCVAEKEYEECLTKVGRILAPFQCK